MECAEHNELNRGGASQEPDDRASRGSVSRYVVGGADGNGQSRHGENDGEQNEERKSPRSSTPKALAAMIPLTASRNWPAKAVRTAPYRARGTRARMNPRSSVNPPDHPQRQGSTVSGLGDHRCARNRRIPRAGHEVTLCGLKVISYPQMLRLTQVTLRASTPAKARPTTNHKRTSQSQVRKSPLTTKNTNAPRKRARTS